MIHVTVGPVRAGKTSRLLSKLLHEACVKEESRSTVLVRSRVDTREFLSHRGDTIPRYSDKIPTVWVDVGKPLSSLDIEKFDVVGIDEAQMFTGLVEAMRGWLAKYPSKKFYVFGIDAYCGPENSVVINTDVCSLSAFALTYKKVHAECAQCIREGRKYPRPANFSYRTVDPKSDTKHVVGGAEMYEPRCVECRHKGIMAKYKDASTDLR